VVTCSFFFASIRRHTRSNRDWSSDVCSSDLHRRFHKPQVRAIGHDFGGHRTACRAVRCLWLRPRRRSCRTSTSGRRVELMAHDFKVLSSELLLDAPIVAVRQDKLAMPNDQVAFREVIEHMGAVAVVAVNENNEIAMVNQYRHSVKRRLWEI